jgi:hypothetical protein
MSTMKRTTPAKFRAFDPQLWMRHGGGASDLLTAVAIDDAPEPKKDVEHRIDIEPTHYTSTGPRYRVMYLGETILEGARTPLFDACRVLLARRITGTLVMYRRGDTVPRAKSDIEKGAESTIIETAKDGPRLGRYRPYPSGTGEDEAE